MGYEKWVAGWGCAKSTIAQNCSEYISDHTFRYIIYSTLNSSALRLHFSNEFNLDTTEITMVNIAICQEKDIIDLSTVKPVTFNNGQTSLIMGAGEDAISDPVDFNVSVGQEIAVNIYLKNMTMALTGQSNGGHFIRKYYAKGNQLEAAALPVKLYGEGGPYLFLNTIDFLTSDDSEAIIAFGDSITAQPWPDFLAHKLVDNGITNRSIIRKAISGNRILRDYEHRIKKQFGPAGIKRFKEDISQAGATKVFILQGINDILHPEVNGRYCDISEFPSFDELISGYNYYIDTAKSLNTKIYIATLLPCPRFLNNLPQKEKMRLKINEWIRNNNRIDNIIDFEAAVWNPDNHQYMIDEYDSGDHLHPSIAGARKMADSIPLDFVTK